MTELPGEYAGVGTILRYATLEEVAAACQAIEAAHPGTIAHVSGWIVLFTERAPVPTKDNEQA
jgi:hypothetical protein